METKPNTASTSSPLTEEVTSALRDTMNLIMNAKDAESRKEISKAFSELPDGALDALTESIAKARKIKSGEDE